MRFWSVTRGPNTSTHAPCLTRTHNRYQVVISFFIRAPIKNMPILSATLLAVALVSLQLGVIDPYIVDEISKVWKTVEVLPCPPSPPTTPRSPQVRASPPCLDQVNGTAVDSDLREVTDRLESLETLFNVTI